MRALVVEDDPGLAPLIVDTYDCVVADRGLPDGDALEPLKRWRRSGHTVPVLMLTSFSTVEDRVSGFENRADDYLVKPFAMAELTARVRARCRRGQPQSLPEVAVGGLALGRVGSSSLSSQLTAGPKLAAFVASAIPGRMYEAWNREDVAGFFADVAVWRDDRWVVVALENARLLSLATMKALESLSAG